MRRINARNGSRHQRGLTLMIVLIALVSMSLAALALIRSIDTGTLVMGNLSFKQAATTMADRSAEAAITWLQNNNTGTTLYNSRCSSGCTTADTTTAYYATSLDALDIAAHSTSASRALVDWSGNGCSYATSGTYTACFKASTPVTVDGYVTSYIIARMCKIAGDPNATGNNCAKPLSTASSSSPKKGELKYGEDKRFSGTAGPYYRIVVRASGPRNTVSYTETYVHF